MAKILKILEFECKKIDSFKTLKIGRKKIQIHTISNKTSFSGKILFISQVRLKQFVVSLYKQNKGIGCKIYIRPPRDGEVKKVNRRFQLTQ